MFTGLRASAARHRRKQMLSHYEGHQAMTRACIFCQCTVASCRGQRAVAEASERLQRAMDKADAELADAQKSRRTSRARYHSPRHGREDRPDSNGLHRAGYTAEHDYDRFGMCIIKQVSGSIFGCTDCTAAPAAACSNNQATCGSLQSVKQSMQALHSPGGRQAICVGTDIHFELISDPSCIFWAAWY